MNKESKILETYLYIKSILKNNKIAVSNYQLIDYGLQFTVSISNWSGIIRIYQNKKGILKIDTSQLSNDSNALKIKTLIEPSEISTISNIKNVEFEFPIIGTDESGKGDYFGPLVCAGVYVDNQSAKDLIAFGVKDSKELNDRKNVDLAKNIVEICKERIVIIEIPPKTYNDLYEQFRKEKKTLNTLLAWGHAKAIEELLSKVDCRIAIADQFADESFIINKLQEKGKGIKLIQMHKAEQNIAVAAASILARSRFLEKLSKLSNEYKIDLQKGASGAVVDNAKKFVAIYGEKALRNVAKLHFKLTTHVINKSFR